MSKFTIADFEVEMNCQSEFLNRLAKTYRLDGQESDKQELDGQAPSSEQSQQIDLSYTEEELEKAKEEPDFTLAMFEYNTTLLQFLQKILPMDGFCFHASALACDGEAVLFSADSGTGKSTHAGLWEKYLSAEHELVRLNDDKPIIRLKEDGVWAYGSPWSGKHCIHTNAKAPVKALVFLKRGEQNAIRRVPMQEAFSYVFPQTFLDKSNPVQRVQILDLLDRFIRKVPVYELTCNISEEAVQLVYTTIWEENKK